MHWSMDRSAECPAYQMGAEQAPVASCPPRSSAGRCFMNGCHGGSTDPPGTGQPKHGDETPGPFIALYE
ncbi:hypothetical protein AGIG_G20894 [Arapaima gigas]